MINMVIQFILFPLFPVQTCWVVLRKAKNVDSWLQKKFLQVDCHFMRENAYSQNPVTKVLGYIIQRMYISLQSFWLFPITTATQIERQPSIKS